MNHYIDDAARAEEDNIFGCEVCHPCLIRQPSEARSPCRSIVDAGLCSGLVRLVPIIANESVTFVILWHLFSTLTLAGIEDSVGNHHSGLDHAEKQDWGNDDKYRGPDGQFHNSLHDDTSERRETLGGRSEVAIYIPPLFSLQQISIDHTRTA